MKNSTFTIIASFVGLGIFFLILVFNVPFIPQESMCDSENDARRLAIDGGTITKKFRDSPNHNYKTIRYVVDGDEKESRIFVLEGSGCYDYLQEGDVVYKSKGELLFKVKRNEKDTLFVLDYGCK